VARNRNLEREEVRLWLADSEDCLKVAEQNFELENYHVAAFFVHSALERALKAAVAAFRQKAPPKTHNLKRLYSEVADQVRLRREQVDFLGDITPASQTSRYVDVAMALPREVYSKTLVERYLSSAKPVLGVIRRRLRA
jgi:HEPN domain-containing protein